MAAEHLKTKLRGLSAQWRKTAEQTNGAKEEMQDALLQAHIQGVRDGLLIAANDVDKLLAESNGGSPY